MKKKETKLNPIPKTNLREKKGYWQEWLKDENGKWVIRRENYVKTFDSILREWQITKSEIVWLQPSDLGCVKVIEFDIIIERSGFTETMKLRKIYALQHMRAEIPNIEEYESLHLKLLKPTFYKRRFEKGAICLSDFSTHATQKLSIGIDRRIKPIGKEQLITKAQVRELLKSCKVLGIFTEINSRLTECVGFTKA